MRGMPATPISGEGVFSLGFMASIAYVASAIPCLVSLEVVEALGPALRQGSSVTVMRIKAVVDMAVKAVTAVKPGASAKKHPTDKPIGPVVAVRSTVIGLIVEVAVRTNGSRSDVYADGNLGRGRRCTPQQCNCENCKSKRIDFEHDHSFDGSEFQPRQLSASIIPEDQYGQVGLWEVSATCTRLVRIKAHNE
jgi:hypothetical protein